MNIKLKKFPLSGLNSCKTLIVPIFQSKSLHASKPLKCFSENSEKVFSLLDTKFEKRLSAEIKKGKFSAKAEEKLSIRVPNKKTVLEEWVRNPLFRFDWKY